MLISGIDYSYCWGNVKITCGFCHRESILWIDYLGFKTSSCESHIPVGWTSNGDVTGFLRVRKEMC